jgi:hypothetical protein
VNDKTRKDKDYDGSLLQDINYQSLAAIYAAVIDPVAGGNNTVPDTWNDDGTAKSKGSSRMTWKQLADLLDISRYFRNCVSPGLMQPLIDTAYEILEWLEQIWPDIQSTYPRAGGPFGDMWSYFGVTQFNLLGPRSELLKNWLLQPRHNILVGAAKIRRGYNGVVGLLENRGSKAPEQTYWDLPRVAGAYNADRVKDPGPTDAARTWGIRYYEDYMSTCGSVYNGVIDYFGSVIIPPVRLMK